MSTFTPKEKERIFIERTQDLWPQNWAGYLELIKHETWSMGHRTKRILRIERKEYQTY